MVGLGVPVKTLAELTEETVVCSAVLRCEALLPESVEAA